MSPVRILNRPAGGPPTSLRRCCKAFLPLWHPAQSGAGLAEIDPTGPTIITTYSRLASLVGRASYPYEGNNPVSSPLLLLYSCTHPAGIERDRVSMPLRVDTFGAQYVPPITTPINPLADSRHLLFTLPLDD